jgi:glycosyltransferase involved in cell wall biosynthesis
VRALIDYRPALRLRTGVGEYTHELSRALASGYAHPGASMPLELVLFSSSWKDRLAPGADFDATRLVDRRVPVSLLNFAWHRLGWPSAETLAGMPIDVAHSSHPLLMPSRTAAQIVTIHDLDFLVHPERTRAEVRRDYPALAADHAHRADAVIVSSAFAAAEVERLLKVPTNRISVCPAGAPSWTARAASPQDGYVLFFGTLEPRKNVGGLLDAYERLLARVAAPPELVLAGAATDAATPWLARIARPPLAGRVRHIGYVAPGDKRALYERARVLVQPSFEEGFGLTVLEAMTSGVPVVAANRGSLPEVLAGSGALVSPDDPDAIAQGIEAMLRDDGYAQNCATQGIARAREFTWAETARRVFETYQRAIERRTRRQRRA